VVLLHLDITETGLRYANDNVKIEYKVLQERLPCIMYFFYYLFKLVCNTCV
jgi:hypothetical protein